MKRLFLIIIYGLIFSSLSFAQNNIDRYQYWFNEDYGSRITQTVSPVQTYTLSDSINMSGLTHGLHTLNIRMRQSNGLWSCVSTSFVVKLNATLTNSNRKIVSYEYWFNTDHINKTSGTASNSTSYVFIDSVIVNSLAIGLNTFNIRFKDDAGLWSSIKTDFFVKQNLQYVSQRNITTTEFWFNEDYANRISTSANSNPTFLYIDSASVNGLNTGLNSYNIRFKDNAGLWTSIKTHFFIKPEKISVYQRNVTSVEYWFNYDFGNRILSNTPSNNPSFIYLDSIDVSSLPNGVNLLSIRFKDDAGLWSSTKTSFILKKDGNITMYNKDLVALEYWFNDDHLNTQSISIANQSSFNWTDSIDLSGLFPAAHRLNYRFKDVENLWSPVSSRLFVKMKDPEPIVTKEIAAYRYWVGDNEATVREIDLANHTPNLYLIDSADLRLLNADQYILHFQFLDSSGVWSGAVSDTVQKDFYPYIEFDADNPVICQGGTTPFNYDTADVNMLIWNYEANEQDTSFSPTHQYLNAGTFDVSVSAINSDSSVVNVFTEYSLVLVNPTYDIGLFDTVCFGDSLQFEGNWYSGTGIYSAYLTTSNGCDSIRRLNLFEKPQITGSEIVSICDGDSYTFGTQTLTQAGTYTEVFEAADGCDSTVTLNLIVNPVYSVADYATICNGDIYQFGGQGLTSAGIYVDTITTTLGCDSVVTLTLTVNPIHHEYDTATICDGESFTFGNNTMTIAGSYTDTFSNIYTCDSVVTLELIVNPSYYIYDTVSICQGESYQFGSITLNTSGDYYDSLNTGLGCDSIRYLNLTVRTVDTNVTVAQSGTNFILTSSATTATYQWLDCNNSYSTISGETNSSFTPVVDGTYAVEVTQNNCSDTSDCHMIIGIGISSIDGFEEISIYPNPTNGQFWIELPEGDDFVIEIFDITSKKLQRHENVNSNRFMIDLSAYERGVYILRLVRDGDVFNAQIVKNG